MDHYAFEENEIHDDDLDYDFDADFSGVSHKVADKEPLEERVSKHHDNGFTIVESASDEISGATKISLNRKRTYKQSLENAGRGPDNDQIENSTNNDAQECSSSRPDNFDEIVDPSLIRQRSLKRILPPDSDDLESLQKIGPEIFELSSSPEKVIREDDADHVFRSLDVDPNDVNIRLGSVLVKKDRELSIYDVSRILAEFKPLVVRGIDDNTCVARFENHSQSIMMLIEMSKPLRRVRTPKKAEDGELISEDEEEEGQVKEEDGEDISVVRDGHVKQHKNLLRSADVVEVDVEKIEVPPGKWRVLTKHVPEEKLVLVRFATGFELRKSVLYNPVRSCSSLNADLQEDYSNVWSSRVNGPLRAGLNIFDKDGNELDWDYEHDTRFFENRSPSPDDSPSKRIRVMQNETEINDGGETKKIKTRGRGRKKFFGIPSRPSDDDEEP